jgi:hypothetical protein
MVAELLDLILHKLYALNVGTRRREKLERKMRGKYGMYGYKRVLVTTLYKRDSSVIFFASFFLNTSNDYFLSLWTV